MWIERAGGRIFAWHQLNSRAFFRFCFAKTRASSVPDWRCRAWVLVFQGCEKVSQDALVVNEPLTPIPGSQWQIAHHEAPQHAEPVIWQG